MFRRFFQRLEQRVEGAAAEAMHFVDDVDFVLPLAGREGDLVAQVAHVVDAGMGRRVDLDQVEVAPFVDGDAGGALVAGAAVNVGIAGS